MSEEQDQKDKSALEALFAASGVGVTAADLEAVAASLERIRVATSSLLRQLPFDNAVEAFDHLLENNQTGEAFE